MKRIRCQDKSDEGAARTTIAMVPHNFSNMVSSDCRRTRKRQRRLGLSGNSTANTGCTTPQPFRRVEVGVPNLPSSSLRLVSVVLGLLLLLVTCCGAFTCTPNHRPGRRLSSFQPTQQLAVSYSAVPPPHPSPSPKPRASPSSISEDSNHPDQNNGGKKLPHNNSDRTQRGTMRSVARRKQKRHHNTTWKSRSGNTSTLGRGKSKQQQARHRQRSSSSSKAVFEFNQLIQTILEDDTTDGSMTNNRLRRRPPTWDSVQQAQNLLLARVRSSSEHKNSNNRPSSNDKSNKTKKEGYDVISFNIVLQAWAKQHSMEAAQAADDLLNILWQETNLRADSYSYAAVLHAYAKANGGRVAALRATELLKRFIQLSIILTATANSTTMNNNKKSKRRTDICHNAAMDAWAVSGDAMAGHRAEQILRQLQQDPLRTATRVSFNSVIKAYARSGQPEEAQRILDEMKELVVQTSDRSVAPDKVSLSTCIHAWAKSTNDLYRAASCADALLCEMEQAYEDTKDERMRPDVVAYSSVLAAMAKSPMGTSAKAIDLLKRMKRFGKEKPNAAFMNSWINMLSKSNETATAVSSAETILEYMKDEFTKYNWNLQPCKVTYTAVISVLSRGVCTAATADRAEELLDELLSLWDATGEEQYLPNAKTFASVLNTLSKCRLDDGIERGEKLLSQMQGLYNATNSQELRPNVIIYMQMFQILARSQNPDAGKKAKELLQEMNHLYLSGFEEVRPDATTMAYFLNTLTKCSIENTVEIATHVVNEVEEGYRAGIGHLKPTSLLYSSCLQAYAKSSSEEGARLAEELLDRTKVLYREGKLYAKPNVLFYNAVIDAHARSSGGVASAERAEILLDEMEAKNRAGDASVCPNTRTFNAVILAWRNSNSKEAPRRAEALLKRMNEQCKAGDEACRPDRVTLNTIIDVYAKSSDPQAPARAAEYLRFMQFLYLQGDANFRPDSFTFNSCIDAYGRRGNGPDAQALFDLMNQMAEKDQHFRPSIITLTALQSAWKKSPQTTESLQRLASVQEFINEQRRLDRDSLKGVEHDAHLSASRALAV